MPTTIINNWAESVVPVNPGQHITRAWTVGSTIVVKASDNVKYQLQPDGAWVTSILTELTDDTHVVHRTVGAWYAAFDAANLGVPNSDLHRLPELTTDPSTQSGELFDSGDVPYPTIPVSGSVAQVVHAESYSMFYPQSFYVGTIKLAAGGRKLIHSAFTPDAWTEVTTAPADAVFIATTSQLGLAYAWRVNAGVIEVYETDVTAPTLTFTAYRSSSAISGATADTTALLRNVFFNYINAAPDTYFSWLSVVDGTGGRHWFDPFVDKHATPTPGPSADNVMCADYGGTTYYTIKTTADNVVYLAGTYPSGPPPVTEFWDSPSTKNAVANGDVLSKQDAYVPVASYTPSVADALQGVPVKEQLMDRSLKLVGKRRVAERKPVYIDPPPASKQESATTIPRKSSPSSKRGRGTYIQISSVKRETIKLPDGTTMEIAPEFDPATGKFMFPKITRL